MINSNLKIINKRRKFFESLQKMPELAKIDSLYNQNTPRKEHISPVERQTNNYGYMEMSEIDENLENEG